MSTALLVLLVAVPLSWHVALALYAYYDAGRRGMNQTKWGIIAILVPFFGFIAYVFERGERFYDPQDDPYASGGYNMPHESGHEPSERGRDARSPERDEQRNDADRDDFDENQQLADRRGE